MHTLMVSEELMHAGIECGSVAVSPYVTCCQVTVRYRGSCGLPPLPALCCQEVPVKVGQFEPDCL